MTTNIAYHSHFGSLHPSTPLIQVLEMARHASGHQVGNSPVGYSHVRELVQQLLVGFFWWYNRVVMSCWYFTFLDSFGDCFNRVVDTLLFLLDIFGDMCEGNPLSSPLFFFPHVNIFCLVLLGYLLGWYVNSAGCSASPHAHYTWTDGPIGRSRQAQTVRSHHQSREALLELEATAGV